MVIRIKFLLVMLILYPSVRSRELSMWWFKMNSLDILKTLCHCFTRDIVFLKLVFNLLAKARKQEGTYRFSVVYPLLVPSHSVAFEYLNRSTGVRFGHVQTVFFFEYQFSVRRQDQHLECKHKDKSKLWVELKINYLFTNILLGFSISA